MQKDTHKQLYVLLAWITFVFAGTAIFLLFNPVAISISIPTTALIFFGLLAEICAVSLPGFGKVSIGCVFWTALALNTQSSPGFALLVGGLSAIISSLFYNNQNSKTYTCIKKANNDNKEHTPQDCKDPMFWHWKGPNGNFPYANKNINTEQKLSDKDKVYIEKTLSSTLENKNKADNTTKIEVNKNDLFIGEDPYPYRNIADPLCLFTSLALCIVTIAGINHVNIAGASDNSKLLAMLLLTSIIYPATLQIIPGLINPHTVDFTDMQGSLRLGKTFGISLCLPGLGILTAYIIEINPLYALCIVPLCITLNYAANLIAESMHIEDNMLLKGRLNNIYKQLRIETVNHKNTSLALSSKTDEYSLLETVVELFGTCRSQDDMCRTILELINRLIRVDSAVIFMPITDNLDDSSTIYFEPQAWTSCKQKLLSTWTLIKAEEPVVNEAWVNLQCVTATSSDKCGLKTEHSKLAVRIPQRGVIYFGRENKAGFTQREVKLAELIANQSKVAWESAVELETKEKAVLHLQSSNELLDSRAKKLEALLQNMQGLLNFNSPQAILEEIEAIIRSVAECDYVCLVIGHHRVVSRNTGEVLIYDKDENGESLDIEDQRKPYVLKDKVVEYESEAEKGFNEIARAACQNLRPLLIDNIKNTRFCPPTAETVSVLAVPIIQEKDSREAIILSSEKEKAFTRQDQDLLFTLAYHLSAVFNNYHLHNQLKKAHKELKESQAAIIQSSKLAAVGQLAAGVAHELNTPLGAVILGIDSGLNNLNRNDPEKTQKRLDTARKSAIQAKNIVSKLLFYSRQAGQSKTETDVNKVITDTLELIGHHIKNENIILKTELNQLTEIQANQNELQQVITNLVINAKDALKNLPGDQKRQISIETYAHQDTITIKISDNGQGISQENLSHLFEPFFTTKPVNQGTGLGLSVSLEIIKNHQGNIMAESKKGLTVFTVTLPINSNKKTY